MARGGGRSARSRTAARSGGSGPRSGWPWLARPVSCRPRSSCALFEVALAPPSPFVPSLGLALVVEDAPSLGKVLVFKGGLRRRPFCSAAASFSSELTLPPSPLGSVTQPFRSFSRRSRRCRNDVSFSSLCPQEAITAPEAAFPPSPVAPPPASLALSALSGHKVGGAGSSAIRLPGEGPSPPTSSPSPRRGDLDSAPLFCTSPSRPATEYRSSAPPWSRHLGPP